MSGGWLSPVDRFYLKEVLRGLLITGWHFWRNIVMHTLHAVGLCRGTPAGVTIQYPEVRRRVPARARMVHRIRRRLDGGPRCVACMLCASVCPSNCIHIVAEECPDPGIEKRPAVFSIDLSRCIFCGFCVEACPVDAIRMDTGIVPPAAFNRFALVLTKEDLMANGASTGTVRTISGRFLAGMSSSQDFMGLLLFSVLVAGNFAAMIVMAHFLGRLAARKGEPVKGEPFECGYPEQAPLPERVPVTFYVAGLLLLVFDVEVVFLYPWAAEFRALGVFGFVEMLVFIGLLAAGYLYLLRKGAFRW